MEMRLLIQIVENYCSTSSSPSLPDWLERGEIVPDPSTLNDDCNDILEPEEWDYEWRLCQVPVGVFGSISRPSFKKRHENMDDSSETRLDRIRNQLRHDPLIATLKDDGSVSLLDGHHRLWVIAKERGEETVRTLVGIPCPKEALNEGGITGYTREELERMDIDDLDRMAFGVATGDIVQLKPSEIRIKFPGDLENAEAKFEHGGLRWAQSVDLSEPVKVSVNENGEFELEDGHHRWFAATVTNRPLDAEIEVMGNPIRKILGDRVTEGNQSGPTGLLCEDADEACGVENGPITRSRAFELVSFEDEQTSAEVVDLITSLSRQYRYAIGRKRIAFIRENGVIKVPLDDYGQVDNFQERVYFLKQLKNGADIPIARCRLVKRSNNLFVLVMDRVDPIGYDEPDRPWWADFVDCNQVGRTRSGAFRAYDLGS